MSQVGALPEAINNAEIGVLRSVVADLVQQEQVLIGVVESASIPKLETYLRSQADFTMLIRVIADVRNELLFANINKSLAHTIEIDESTDKSIKSALAIFFHFEQGGKERVEFGGLVELTGGTARAIVADIKTFYERRKLNRLRLVGGAMDNCSTMMGAENGVKILLTTSGFPNFFLVQGDGAHLWQIAFKNGASLKYNAEAAAIKELDKHTRSIAAYTRRSAKAKKELLKIDPKAKVKARHAVRWKSIAAHQLSLCLSSAYKALRVALPGLARTAHKKTKAKLLAGLQYLSDYCHLLLLHVEADINETAAIFTQQFEYKQMDVVSFEDNVRKQDERLCKLCDTKGKQEKLFHQMVERAVDSASIESLFTEQQSAMQRENSGDVPPPANNYSAFNGSLWACCDGTTNSQHAHIQCTLNPRHFVHRECVDIGRVQDFKCSICIREAASDEENERDSDEDYYDDEDEDENEEKEDGDEDEDERLHTFRVKGTTILLYNQSQVTYPMRIQM